MEIRHYVLLRDKPILVHCDTVCVCHPVNLQINVLQYFVLFVIELHTDQA